MHMTIGIKPLYRASVVNEKYSSRYQKTSCLLCCVLVTFCLVSAVWVTHAPCLGHARALHVWIEHLARSTKPMICTTLCSGDQAI